MSSISKDNDRFRGNGREETTNDQVGLQSMRTTRIGSEYWEPPNWSVAWMGENETIMCRDLGSAELAEQQATEIGDLLPPRDMHGGEQFWANEHLRTEGRE